MNILLSIPRDFFSIEWPGALITSPYKAEAWIVDPEHPVTEEMLNKMPRLEVIVTASTGRNHIDIEACMRRDIKVLSLLDNRYALDEIRASSEFTFLLILNALRRLDVAKQDIFWMRDADEMRGHELYKKLVGMVGHGRIGKNIENWCNAFGAGVYWTDPHDKSNLFQPHISWLFSNCNIIVICCTLSWETEGMIGGKLLKSMKQGACLVNTARGEIIVENELVEVAKQRPDLTFCLDVLSGESVGAQLNSPLLDLPNVVITPHVCGLAYESNEKAAQIAAGLLRDFKQGRL